MIQLTVSKNIPQNGNIILLETPSCDFSQYGFSAGETEYIRQQLSAKEKQVAVQRNGCWTFVQITDVELPADELKEKMRRGAAKIHEWTNRCHIRSITVVDAVGREELAFAFAEGLVLSNYRFLKYVSKREEKCCSLTEVFLAGKSVKQEAADELNCLLDAVYRTRDMINEPANVMTAVRLASEIEAMAAGTGLTVQVLDKAAMEEQKMGGILAVNRGSAEAPAFSVIEWRPAQARNRRPVVLAGKGLVYDTGGLSLKPTANSMDSMKCDMSGGAAVAAVLYAVAKANLPVYVVGLVPSTDNRISATAYAPGDVITMSDGTTVETLNSDAEGRLILADALVYAQRYEPELIIDVATLTGAAHRAIGEKAIAGMGNAPRSVMEKLKECGMSVYERIAELPFWDDYADALKSDIADLKNIGGECAGAITAGKFLEHFTGKYPYIHLDIAGPAFLKAADGYHPKGGTGSGVRLLFEFLKKY
jgi:leucyl aminopeptidase